MPEKDEQLFAITFQDAQMIMSLVSEIARQSPLISGLIQQAIKSSMRPLIKTTLGYELKEMR